MRCKVYHTTRSGADRSDVLRKAPFRAVDNPQYSQWLGSGYYFWETFKDLAKWWGDVHYIRRGKHYIVFSSTLNCSNRHMLDLVGNSEQIKDILLITRELQAMPEFQDTVFSAQFIINYIEKIGFRYKAIRVYGEESCSSDKNITNSKLFFNCRSYINLCPEIQICVKDLRVIQLPMKFEYCSEDDPNNTIIA